MMRDLIERFGYRYRLWVAEKRGERLGAGSTSETLIYREDEAVPKMVIRHIGALLGGILVLTGVGRTIVIHAPKAAFAVFVVVVVLVSLWIILGVFTLIGEWSAKKARSVDRDQNHLTNR
jgi:hypothetical protein